MMLQAEKQFPRWGEGRRRGRSGRTEGGTAEGKNWGMGKPRGSYSGARKSVPRGVGPGIATVDDDPSQRARRSPESIT